jgi:hypothetical protein
VRENRMCHYSGSHLFLLRVVTIKIPLSPDKVEINILDTLHSGTDQDTRIRNSEIRKNQVFS